MGVDVSIAIKCKSGWIPNYELPQGFELNDADQYWMDEHPEVTHVFVSAHRYYDIGYERGQWPKICSALLSLLADEMIETVWYQGGDSSTLIALDADRLFDISRHWICNANRPYRERQSR